MALLRRQMPGCPLEGGAVAEGTRIRHYEERYCQIITYMPPQTDATRLIEVLKHLRPKFVDRLDKFVGNLLSHALEPLQ